MADDSDRQQVPPSTAQSSVPPTYRHVIDQDYAISMLMEMQKSMGKLEQAVATISFELSDIKKKVNTFEKILYAGGILLTIFLFIGGWAINAAKDVWLEGYKSSLEQKKLSSDNQGQRSTPN